MKEKTIIKEGKWTWPLSDENGWTVQNEYLGLSEKILPYLTGRTCMVQAGGNCGYMLSTFMSHFDAIYTFEPDPVNFYCLVNNVSEEKVIKLQCCLGDTLQPVNTTQLIRPGRLHDVGGVHVSGEGFTPTLTLDLLNLPACDLIQLDVEGFELSAIKGGINTIKKFHPVLCIEFCEKWLNRYNTNSQQLLELITELGYQEVNSHGADKIFTYKN